MGQTDHKKQFSKRLARYGAIAWGFYLVIIAVLIYFQPETAIAGVYLALIVTVNKMLDTWAYTKNSIYEKSLLAMLDKTKMELSLKAGGKISHKDGDDGESDFDEEGDGNG